MGADSGFEAWWAETDARTRALWLDLGDADVAPPELGTSLAAAVGPEARRAAGFRGWLLPADLWRFLRSVRRVEE